MAVRLRKVGFCKSQRTLQGMLGIYKASEIRHTGEEPALE